MTPIEYGVMCIQRHPYVAWCGRSISNTDAVFLDADHACECYRTPKGNHGIVVCGMCQNTYKKAGERQER